MEENNKLRGSTFSESLSQSFQIKAEAEERNKFLKIQKDNYNIWRKQELKYLGKFLTIHNFAEHPLDRWNIAGFRVNGEYDLTCVITTEWESVAETLSKKGLDIANKIIKHKCNVHLRSLACDVKMKVRLVGDSSLIVISRNEGYIENYSPVIKITRDTSLKGIFAMFGCVDLATQKFNYCKQVQIPEDPSLQPLSKNYKELEITFSDNGDARVHLTICSFGKYNTIKQFVTFCENFRPFLQKSKILIGGCGENVMLKSVSIQQRERVNTNKPNERPEDCCCALF